jgi:hypothetical protein
MCLRKKNIVIGMKILILTSYIFGGFNMKKIVLIMMMMALLCMGAVSYAGVYVGGHVNNMEGRPIVGATLTWELLHDDVIVHTNSSGYYWFFAPNGWCGTKRVWVSATGYITRLYHVRDDSCCECSQSCPPGAPTEGCSNISQTFWLNGPDYDKDGYFDIEDNCPTVANGPDGGTCTSGARFGEGCDRHSDCVGCTAYCSLAQEDSDGDGVGDACEGGSAQSSMAGQRTIAANLTSLDLFGLWLPFYCAAQGSCDYDCIGQAVEDFFNGRDAFVGEWIRPEGTIPQVLFKK